MDCRSVSAAERVCDCDEGVQCQNERKPIFFIWAIYCYPGWLATVDVLCHSGAGTPSKLFSVNALLVWVVEGLDPLGLRSMVKRGAQPGAGTIPAGQDNSRCYSLIGCYGISGRPFIASNNLRERFS